MSKNYEINFTQGKLFPALWSFAIPVILSGILQLLYNAADIIVVGRFAGEESLAAVGSTSSMINLLVNLFMGLALGANVLISRGYGSGNDKLLHRAVHTTILVAFCGGILFGTIGFIFSRPILEWMGSPDDVIEKSTLYVKIYFAGLPALSLFNFGNAILRAVGDTRRPLFALMISGIINVILNLILVIVFHMDVAGVAIATVTSEIFSAIYVLLCLIRTDRPYRLILKKLRIYKAELSQLLQVGLPSGVQSSLFSLSNVLIQSTINSFGTLAIAGSAAAGNIEGFVYTAMNSMQTTVLTASAQNLSVKNFDRIRKGMYSCLLLVCLIGIPLSALTILFAKPLVSIYTDDLGAIDYGIRRLYWVCLPYCICGMMDVLSGVLRGLAHSFLPMVVSLLGSCVFRIFWIFCILDFNRTWEMLFLAYPISWTITSIAHYISIRILLPRLERRLSSEDKKTKTIESV